jgi:hypothetical protein
MTGEAFVEALAYINWGRFVADCPDPACTSAVALEPGQSVVHCAQCFGMAEVVWPEDPAGLLRVLRVRPDESTRNWFPRNHPFAVAAGLPHGQTVAELEAESRVNGVV